jgi:hypothetical protein
LFTEEGLANLIKRCPNLSVLNLSGCRGIPTSMRRNAFKALGQKDAVSYEESSEEEAFHIKTGPKRKRTRTRGRGNRRAAALGREWAPTREYSSEEDSDFELSD